MQLFCNLVDTSIRVNFYNVACFAFIDVAHDFLGVLLKYFQSFSNSVNIVISSATNFASPQ